MCCTTCIVLLLAGVQWAPVTVCAIQREKISFSVLNSNKIPIFIKRIESLQVFLGFYEIQFKNILKNTNRCKIGKQAFF